MYAQMSSYLVQLTQPSEMNRTWRVQATARGRRSLLKTLSTAFDLVYLFIHNAIHDAERDANLLVCDQ
jgi:hypothetical protein